ncbi:aldehyde dehydrogenase family protein [Sorangium sp. So ce1000]|uniref:aldehyde dehydrogenase family protein n=1 Tax=Sorangium sp. So ce1000 TaxID=3133325 RepID=UPI003F5D6EA9
MRSTLRDCEMAFDTAPTVTRGVPAEAATRQTKDPLPLETGGTSPAVVLQDADLDQAVELMGER